METKKIKYLKRISWFNYLFCEKNHPIPYFPKQKSLVHCEYMVRMYVRFEEWEKNGT